MQFKIIESTYTPEKIITQKYVQQLLRTNYSEAMQAQPIYRGMGTSNLNLNWKKPRLIKPGPGRPRKSANTYNYYTLIINNSPDWKYFPKREIICTTESAFAEGYGNVYRVYPKNGAKIGICPEDDIWGSKFGFYNELVNIIFEHFHLGKMAGVNIEENYQEFFKACAKVDANRNELTDVKKWDIPDFNKDHINKTFRRYITGKGTFFNYLLKKLYNPSQFEWMPIKNFKTDMNVHEVWTDSPCLMISEEED